MWPFKRKTESPSTDVGLDPLVKEYQFCATLQLRTPLAVLEMHGKAIPARGPAPIVEPLWHGIWVPVGQTWRELGIDIDEMPTSMASEVGYVPSDGGDFLKLLKRIREVVEAPGSVSMRRSRLQSLLTVLPWPDLVTRLGGEDVVVDEFFPSFLIAGARLKPTTASALEFHGKGTPRRLAAMSDKELLAVQGIGPKTLLQIRFACETAEDPDAAHIESDTARTHRGRRIAAP